MLKSTKIYENQLKYQHIKSNYLKCQNLKKGVVFKRIFSPKGFCCRTQELGDPK